MAHSPEQIRTILAAEGRKANRALGQNFCTDGALLASCVDAAGLDGLPVLEIGPGLGALTAPLLQRASRVVAVEKDAALAALLPSLLPSERLTVVTGDILRTDVGALMQGEDFALCGNLPYYITTPIAEQFLPMLPRVLLLMVQQEAAARFFAAPGDRVYGPVAILSALYYEAARLFSVPPGSYYPQPDVESAVILLRRRDDDALKALPAANAMLRFSRTALSMRRKTLANNFPRDGRMSALLAEAGLDPAVRAETLPPETLAALCTAYPADDALSAR